MQNLKSVPLCDSKALIYFTPLTQKYQARFLLILTMTKVDVLVAAETFYLPDFEELSLGNLHQHANVFVCFLFAIFVHI